MKNRMIKTACMISLAVMFAALSSAASDDNGHALVDRTVDGIQKTYDSIRTLRAEFMQLTYPAGAAEGTRASGRVWFSPPDSMRWEYDTPEPQLIVTSGRDVYLYEKEASQVTILSREHFLSTGISRAFFFGKGDIRKLFHVTPGRSNGQIDPLKLVLVPKESNPQIKRIVVTVGKKSHLVREIWFEDNFGGRTRLVFADIRLNEAVNRDLFHFVIPDGVEVYRAE
jgi:outer membrane lipoprotein carrier protein